MFQEISIGLLKEQQRKKDHGICPAPGCKQRVMQILYLITPYDAVDKVSGTENK